MAGRFIDDNGVRPRVSSPGRLTVCAFCLDGPSTPEKTVVNPGLLSFDYNRHTCPFCQRSLRVVYQSKDFVLGAQPTGHESPPESSPNFMRDALFGTDPGPVPDPTGAKEGETLLVQCPRCHFRSARGRAFCPGCGLRLEIR